MTARIEGAFKRRENASGTTFGIDKSGKYATIKAGDELGTDDGSVAFQRWKSAKSAKTIARGEEIDDIARLIQFYGGAKEGWRKMKNIASAIDEEGELYDLEIHWYENSEMGKVDYKPKEF